MQVRSLLIGAAVTALALLGAWRFNAYLQTRQLSSADEARLDGSVNEVFDWCLSRQPPAGGRRKLALAIQRLDRLAESKPRRRTAYEDSAYVTPREQLTDAARQMNGECRRPVPGADELRRRALKLAENRDGGTGGVLSESEVRRRLTHVAPVVALHRSQGPHGTVTLRGFVRRKGDPALRMAVVLGRDAARQVRAYKPRLVPGVSNKTAMHPVDGVDTAVILDTSGLVGAPYTMNTGLPRADRPPAKRRGDLWNATEWALVGEVPP